MNIKEHIEAGHYPKDEFNRSHVPTAYNGIAVIADVNAMRGNCMLGWMKDHSENINNCIGWWQNDGTPYTPVPRLLPPPPRKVKVTTNAIVSRRDGSIIRLNGICNLLGHERLVELTGEYDEPWS